MSSNPPTWAARLKVRPYAIRDSVNKGLWWPKREPYSDWCEKNIIVPDSISSMPGPLDLSRTPYLREPLDVFGDPFIEDITLQWCTQVGKTFLESLMLAAAAGQDPGPALFAMPVELFARQFFEERFIPLLKASPALRTLLSANPYDNTKVRVRLKRMNIWAAWASSPVTLSSHAIRYAFYDECNKTKRRSKEEGDESKLIVERMKTYRYTRKFVTSSTPTTKYGLITKRMQRSDARRFYVQCPHCQHYQTLVFPRIQWPKGPDGEHPRYEEVRDKQNAWYLCEHCEEKITEAERIRLLSHGAWAPEGCTVDKSGNVIGLRLVTRHAGFFLNTLNSLWLSWSDIAAEFLECRHEPALLQNFINAWLAEEWEDPTKSTTLVVDSMPEGAVELMHLPEDTIILLAASDVQGDHVWYVVRAWCGGEVSHLVEEGKLCPVEPDADGEGGMTDLEHLAQTVLKGTWQTPDGTEHQVRLMAVDRRYRTDEVDKFCRANAERCIGISGANRPQAQALQERSVDAIKERQKKRKKRTGLTYLSVVNDYFKVLLSRLMHEGKFKASEDASAAYHRQVNSEHRVEVGSRDGKAVYEWKLKPGSHDNHLWLSEVYCAAAAHYLEYFIDPEALRGGDKTEVVTDWFKRQREKRRAGT